MKNESKKLIIETLLVSAMWLFTLPNIIVFHYSYPADFMIMFVGLTLVLIGDVSLELYNRRQRSNFLGSGDERPEK